MTAISPRKVDGLDYCDPVGCKGLSENDSSAIAHECWRVRRVSIVGPDPFLCPVAAQRMADISPRTDEQGRPWCLPECAQFRRGCPSSFCATDLHRTHDEALCPVAVARMAEELRECRELSERRAEWFKLWIVNSVESLPGDNEHIAELRDIWLAHADDLDLGELPEVLREKP